MSKDVIKKKSIYFNEQLYNEILNGFVDENTQQQIKQNDDKKITVFTSSQKKRIQRVSDAFVQSKGIKNFLQQQIANKFEIFRKKRDENYKTSLMMAQLNQLLNQVQQKQQEEELEDQEEEEKKKKGGGFNILGTINKIQNVIDTINTIKTFHKSFKQHKLKKRQSKKPQKAVLTEQDGEKITNLYRIVAKSMVSGIYETANVVLKSPFVQAAYDTIKRRMQQRVAKYVIGKIFDIIIGKFKIAKKSFGIASKFFKGGKKWDTAGDVTQTILQKANKNKMAIYTTFQASQLLYQLGEFFNFTQQDFKNWDKYVQQIIKPICEKYGEDAVNIIEGLKEKVNDEIDVENGITINDLKRIKKSNNGDFAQQEEKNEQGNQKITNVPKSDIKIIDYISFDEMKKIKDRSQGIFDISLSENSMLKIYNTLPIQIVKKMTNYVVLLNSTGSKLVKDTFVNDSKIISDLFDKITNKVRVEQYFDDLTEEMAKIEYDQGLLLKYSADANNYMDRGVPESFEMKYYNPQNVTVNKSVEETKRIINSQTQSSGKSEEKTNFEKKKKFQWGIGGVQLLTKNLYGYFDGVKLNIKGKKPIEILFEKSSIKTSASDTRWILKTKQQVIKTANSEIQFNTYEKYQSYKNLIKSLNSFIQASGAQMQYQVNFSTIIKKMTENILKI